MDGSPGHAPPSAGLHPSPAEPSRQAPDALDGGCADLPFKQPSCYYKLRNFYSKQYYRQATCPSQERATEQPFPFGAAADLGAVEHPPCAVRHPACALESSEHLPPNFLAQPLSESAPAPASDGAGPPPPTRQMRLKKAVHLKKLNFLKSQESAERTSGPRSDESVTERTEPASDSSVEKVHSQRAEDKESEELLRAEDFHCISELGRPEEPAALEEQPQTPPSQRQYACDLCGKPFKHPSNLELHRRSHTGTLIQSPQAEGGPPADHQTPLPAPVFVRNLLSVTFVGNISLRRVTCRLTYVDIPGKSHTSARSAGRGLQPPGTSSATSLSTREKSRTCVTSVVEGLATSVI